MRTVFSFFLFLLIIQNIMAQVPETFLVDSMNLSVKQTLPFDRPFILGLRSASAKSIYSAFIFEWVINGDERTLKHNKDNKPIYTFIQAKNVINLENGSDVYIPAQSPSKNFAVLLAHRFDSDLLDEALQAGWHLYSGETPNAATVMNGLNEKVEGKIRPVLGIPSSTLKDISVFASEWTDPKKGAVMAGALVNENASIQRGFTDFYTTKLQPIY